MAGRKRRKTYRRWLQALKKAFALVFRPRGRRVAAPAARINVRANTRTASVQPGNGGAASRRKRSNIRRRQSCAGRRFSRRIPKRAPKRSSERVRIAAVLALTAIAIFTALIAGRFFQALFRELPQEELPREDFDNGRWTLLWARLWGEGRLSSAEEVTPDAGEAEDIQREGLRNAEKEIQGEEATDVQDEGASNMQGKGALNVQDENTQRTQDEGAQKAWGAETAKSACRRFYRTRGQALSGTDKIRRAAQQQAAAILEALPKELSAQRRQFVEAALSLAGKVEYRWGGKTPQEGMDCSGFTAWVFGLAESTAAQQREACREIGLEQAEPGDLAFYEDASHVGIVVGRSEKGEVWVCHCASGQNTVVITEAQESGFTQAGRPAWLSGR